MELATETGWTDVHILAMPASRFFLFLRECRKLRLRNLHDLSEIAIVPACNVEYLVALQDKYKAGIRGECDEPTAAVFTDEDKSQQLIGMISGLKNA